MMETEMYIDSRIYTPRDLLEAEIERIFADRPLAPFQVEYILNHYSETWRTYHNCEHLLKMLQILKSVQADLRAEHILLIEVKVVYHDVIFKLKKGTGWNEYNSSQVAVVQLTRAGYDSDFIKIVAGGIECSTSHMILQEFSKWRDCIGIFLDIDILAGLGPTWEECRKNTRLIGQEFSPVMTIEEYRAGRAAWAKTFLKRDKIFHSVHFAPYESVVRENLAKMVG